jgi:PKD repeat protein
VITLIPSALTVSLNSELTITATVIENGVASGGSGGSTSRSGAGTPVQNGTLVTFTTTIGRIEPAEARTHNGSVQVKLITSGTSGNPTITAYSGGASTTNKDIKIGTAGAETVSLTVSPQSLGSSGGSAQLTATVTDTGGAGLGGVPVSFTTDKGMISPATATTDGNGIALATLTTTSTAKIKATAGTKSSAEITVAVSAFGLASFSANPNAAAAGSVINFTVTPTTGANLTNVRVEFGDGRFQNLGGISAATTAANTYCSPGNYNATATFTDAGGSTGSLSTGVIIGALPITLSVSPLTPGVNVPVSFTVNGLGTAQISRFVWTFDDGTPQQTTTSASISHTFTTKGIKNARVDVFGVTGCQIGTAAATLDVI